MGRKDQRRRRRQQSTAAAPTPSRSQPVIAAPDDDDLPIWEKQLEERALRERWPMSPEMRLRIIGRLMDIVEGKRTGNSFVPPTYREQTSAAKAILAADRFNLEEMKIAAIAPSTEVSSDGPKRIVIPDVDERHTPHED